MADATPAIPAIPPVTASARIAPRRPGPLKGRSVLWLVVGAALAVAAVWLMLTGLGDTPPVPGPMGSGATTPTGH